MCYSNFVLKTRHFQIFDFKQCHDLEITDTDWSATCVFLLTFNNNHGSISYRFRDKRWFQSKIAKFSHPVYFVPPMRDSTGCWGQQTWMTGIPGRERSYIISRLDTVHERDRQKDGRTNRRTDTGIQQRPRLRIASRGKYLWTNTITSRGLIIFMPWWSILLHIWLLGSQ